MIRRFPLPGLFAVLLALMAQLGVGGSVPRIDPVFAVGALCHTDDGGSPADQAPGHPADCPVCPLCAALHAPPAVLAAGTVAVPLPSVAVIRVSAFLPPATAPPTPYRPARQPRAPPAAT